MFRLLLPLLLLASCGTTRYYIVRHAEKAPATTMSSDVPLSAEGRTRAQALGDSLRNGGITSLWSTDRVRTRATLEPYREAAGRLPLNLYSSDSLDHYLRLWKRSSAPALLIAGHSNTVDNIVNGLLDRQQLSDLPETRYGDLFIVSRKRHILWTSTRFELRHFGK